MQPGNLRLSLFLKSFIWFGLMGIVLFSAAGDWCWPQGWAFVAIFFFGSILFSLWLMRRDPALLAARLGPLSQKGQPLWDKLFLIVFVLIWFGWLVWMGLDARRWRSSEMPLWINVVGGVLVVLGFLATMRVFRENSFAAPVVRLQSERAQRVIDTGPYAHVRHPMYAAALLYLIGMPLLLGSWYGMLVVPLFVAGIAPRAIAEEQMLKRELPGYADYMTRVRFRLIPGIW